MDPLTAGLVALTSLNQFLVTPAGQKIALDFEQVIGGILSLLNVHLTSSLPSTPKGS